MRPALRSRQPMPSFNSQPQSMRPERPMCSGIRPRDAARFFQVFKACSEYQHTGDSNTGTACENESRL